MDTDRDLFLVSIFTFLTVSLWIFFELVNTTKTSTVPLTVQQVITPLNSTINIEILTELNERKVY